MKKTNRKRKDRTAFLKKSGPRVARRLAEALTRLTGEEFRVEFAGVKTFTQGSITLDAGERCFGAFVRFRSRARALSGMATAIFPRAGTGALTNLLLRRYLKDGGGTADAKLKLSAFKEGVNILVMTYVNEVANGLKVRLEIDNPEFVCFKDVELIKQAVRRESGPGTMVSVGEFNIAQAPAAARRPGNAGRTAAIKGCFIFVF